MNTMGSCSQGDIGPAVHQNSGATPPYPINDSARKFLQFSGGKVLFTDLKVFHATLGPAGGKTAKGLNPLGEGGGQARRICNRVKLHHIQPYWRNIYSSGSRPLPFLRKLCVATSCIASIESLKIVTLL